jgi:hypothetical protein
VSNRVPPDARFFQKRKIMIGAGSGENARALVSAIVRAHG